MRARQGNGRTGGAPGPVNIFLAVDRRERLAPRVSPSDPLVGEEVPLGSVSEQMLEVDDERVPVLTFLKQGRIQIGGDAACIDAASPEGIDQEMRLRHAQEPTAYNCHSSGTPLREWTPLSVKSNPEPVVRSLTVRLAKTSPGPAKAAIRAAMWTAMPPMSSSRSSTSPVWSPARTDSPMPLASPPKLEANRAARAGPSKVARTPSPVVLTTRPEYLSAVRRAIRS